MRAFKVIATMTVLTLVQTHALASAPACDGLFYSGGTIHSANSAWKSLVQKMIYSADDAIARDKKALLAGGQDRAQANLSANEGYAKRLQQIMELSPEEMAAGNVEKNVLPAETYRIQLMTLKTSVEKATTALKLSSQGDRANLLDRRIQDNAELVLRAAESSLSKFRSQNRSKANVFVSEKAKQSALIGSVEYIKRYQVYYIDYATRSQLQGNWSRTLIAELSLVRLLSR